jgi:hypothetical protein
MATRFCSTPEPESPELYTIGPVTIPFAWTHAVLVLVFRLSSFELSIILFTDLFFAADFVWLTLPPDLLE